MFQNVVGRDGVQLGGEVSRTMKPYPKALDWARYICAFLLFTYGISKVRGVQFTVPQDLAQKPIGSLSGYWLTWYYYSYSHSYRLILGFTQITGGALLLFRKTSLLGATLLTPVMANILLINIFFHISAGAAFMSSAILACLLALLSHERVALLQVFWSSQQPEPADSRRLHRWVALLTVLGALSGIVFGILRSHH